MSYALLLFATTLYLEAGNQGTYGIGLVADVINNRAYEFRDTFESINDMIIYTIQEPKQFSCWDNRFPTYQYLIKFSKQNNLETEIRIAQDRMKLLDGVIIKPYKQVTMGKAQASIRRYPNRYTSATHYHTKDVYPKWADNMIRTDIYKDHIFYKEE